MSVILAVDTSSAACSAALKVGGKLFERFELTPKAHTRLVLPMIESVLEEAELSLSDVEAIAFGRGPGSFTGVRIATSIVQGLAYGADLPVVPISTLAALALQVARQEAGSLELLCAIDARMNEVYWAAFQYDEGELSMISEERVTKPDQLPELANNRSAIRLGVGSGWQYSDEFPAWVGATTAKVYADIEPRAAEIALLGASAFEGGHGVSAQVALPVYLRDEVTWKKLPGR